MMNPRWVPAFVLLVAIGCSRKQLAPMPNRSTSATSAVSASASPTTPVATSSALTVGSVSPAARPEHPADKVLAAWNSALDHRDASALEPLYAPRVHFYGQWKTAAQVVALKRAAFAKQPDFRQRVDEVRVKKSDRGFVALFQKHSGAGFAATVAARLTIERAGERFLIAEESDSVTDEHLKQTEPSSCSEAAFQIAGSEPAILADQRRVAREFPEAHPGGITYEEDARHLSAALGYFLPERFDTRWHIEVEGGVLRLTDAYNERAFPLTAEQRARVRRACSDAGPDAAK
jgi:hypothetical protein